MTVSVCLAGYEFSVYTRMARMALIEKGVEYTYEEVNPFSDNLSSDFLSQHPFARVPVLSHGTFSIFETVAITRYVNAAFAGPELEGSDPKLLARIGQVISIIDSYGYLPLIRKVFAHRVFRPAIGEPADDQVVAEGVQEARSVLAALNAIAAEGRVLNSQTFTLADIHLAPMLAYFSQAVEGLDELERHSALVNWWEMMSDRPSLIQTDPALPRGAS